MGSVKGGVENYDGINSSRYTYVLKSCEYVQKNPETFRKFMEILSYLRISDTMITRDRVYAEAERRGFTITNDITFARDHNLFAVLSRYAIMINPALIFYIRPRRSIVDDLDLASAWKKCVTSYKERLRINNWKDAETWLNGKG